MVDVALGDGDTTTTEAPCTLPPLPRTGSLSVPDASKLGRTDPAIRASEKIALASQSSGAAAAAAAAAAHETTRGAAVGHDLPETTVVMIARDAETTNQRDGNDENGERGGGGANASEQDGDDDNAPLVPGGQSRRNSSSGGMGGGMIALEISSSGEGVDENLVLDDDRWRWRHTVSYWVCISFILGSLLFVAGCAFWYKRYVYQSRQRALVTYPFLFGSVCFTVGSYLGLFQAINVGRRGRSLLWRWTPEKDGFLGYLCYFVGALVFNISCVEPLKMFERCPAWVKREMAWGAAEVGSACFIAGAFVEVRHNRCLDVRAAVLSGRWKTLPFWLSWNNLSGGVFFFIAAVAGRWVPESPGWIYTTYLVGSVNFFVASSIMLYMWKGEQYGLGFIPSINRLVPLTRKRAATAHRAAAAVAAAADAAGASSHKGYRRVSVVQFIFVQVCIALTGASFIDFCFATQRFSVYSQYHGFAHFHEVIASLMGVFMAVGLLVMASVLHHTPRIHPFDKLLCWVQIYVAVKLVQILISVGEYYTVALGSDEVEMEAAAAEGAPMVRSGGAMMMAPPPSPLPPVEF